ncbi:MAG: hypothetical protein QY323_01470 [Patescibacteria group bacterium]|nr:MAG: hypothetical protein QY323_01470 [Patescibacteria group bacterium]
MRSFGTPPDPEHAWQEGMTVQTLEFISEAERVIATNTLSEKEVYVLRAKIDRLKDGQESLDESDTFDEWLEQLRHHHP